MCGTWQDWRYWYDSKTKQEENVVQQGMSIDSGAEDSVRHGLCLLRQGVSGRRKERRLDEGCWRPASKDAENKRKEVKGALQPKSRLNGGILPELADRGLTRRAGGLPMKQTYCPRKARTGRNPQTGETIEIPARRVVTFSASSALKGMVNQA